MATTSSKVTVKTIGVKAVSSPKTFTPAKKTFTASQIAQAKAELSSANPAARKNAAAILVESGTQFSTPADGGVSSGKAAPSGKKEDQNLYRLQKPEGLQRPDLQSRAPASASKLDLQSLQRPDLQSRAPTISELQRPDLQSRAPVTAQKYTKQTKEVYGFTVTPTIAVTERKQEGALSFNPKTRTISTRGTGGQTLYSELVTSRTPIGGGETEVSYGGRYVPASQFPILSTITVKEYTPLSELQLFTPKDLNSKLSLRSNYGERNQELLYTPVEQTGRNGVVGISNVNSSLISSFNNNLSSNALSMASSDLFLVQDRKGTISAAPPLPFKEKARKALTSSKEGTFLRIGGELAFVGIRVVTETPKDIYRFGSSIVTGDLFTKGIPALGKFGKDLFTGKAYYPEIGERLYQDPSILPTELLKQTILTKGLGILGSSFSTSPASATEQFIKGPGFAVSKQRVGIIEEFPTVSKITENALEFSKPTRVQTSSTIYAAGIETFGRPIASGSYATKKIEGVSSLSEALPAPVTATGTRALQRATGTNVGAEAERVAGFQTSGRVLGREKGLSVEEAFLNVKEISKPKEFTQIVESEFAKVGVQDKFFFGSGPGFQQLPKGFDVTVGGRTVAPFEFSKIKIGDVDVALLGATPEQTSSFLSSVVQRSKASGINIELSPRNPKVLQTTTGEKILEVKTGLQDLGDEGSIAPAGGLGFQFADIRGGGRPRTVAFGQQGRAITAGEQQLRKTVGSTFFRPGTTSPDVPEAFREGGILPKAGREKDIADYFIQSRGLIEVRRQSRLAPLKEFGTRRAEAGVEQVFSSLSPGQQQATIKLIQERLSSGDLGKSLLSPSASPSTRITKISLSPLSLPKLSTQVNQRGIIDSISPSTLRKSPSPSMLKSLQIYSPSVSISSKFSTSLSPRLSPSSSLSPRLSPDSRFSSSSSPVSSLSPSLKSPSQSPSVRSSSIFSPRSLSPKLRSPSPSPTPKLEVPPLTRLSPQFEFEPEKSKKTEKGYDVYVREGDKRGNRFKKVAKNLPKNRAIAYGIDVVDNYVENSFRLKPSGKKATVPDQPLPPTLEKFRYPKRGSKLPLGTYIERQGLPRLDTVGEIQGLSYFKKIKQGGFF